ncbi:MAG: hypothetical protein ACFFEF_08165 [Candidatus Thorarchaeota archaeon]
MNSRYLVILAAVISSLLVMGFVSAHVPVVGEPGSTPETAIEIMDPTKSLVIYSELQENEEPQYFSFEAPDGMRLRMTLNLPMEYLSSAFRPTVVLIGPDLGMNDTVPSYVEIPSGSEASLFIPDDAIAVYEGFTPSAFLVVLDVDTTLQASGEYYLVVYEPNTGGRYSITLGYREEFSLDEWIMVPINVISIHLWEGQNLLLILTPIVLTVAIGILLILNKRFVTINKKSPVMWLGSIASFLIIGSGISIFFQMILAALQVPIDFQIIITMLFGLMPVLTGYFAFKAFRYSEGNLETSSAIRILVLGVISLFVWGGLLAGPILLWVAGLVGKISAVRTSQV